jgi:hypothetical protein
VLGPASQRLERDGPTAGELHDGLVDGAYSSAEKDVVEGHQKVRHIPIWSTRLRAPLRVAGGA